jgi:Ca-activated chloride channel family protein
MMWHDPLWFVALPFVVGIWWAASRLQKPGLRFPSREGLEPVSRAANVLGLRMPGLLRVAALALMVLAMARPRQGLERDRIRAEGIDIALVADVSTSMLAEDFTLQGRRQNRLEVVKAVVREFVEQRANDRIGLVVFAGRPYTQCPMTLDHGWLLDQLDRTAIGVIEDGTAIGSGIATGLNRLRASTAKSRVMILLTDGVNNAGSVTPDAAAQLAKTLDVKLYAIGAGTKGLAPYPAKDLFGRAVYRQVKIEVDDEGLTRIAEATGGRYFRATDSDSLQRIYADIDRMEKVSLEQPAYQSYRERYPWLVVPALLLLLLEVGVGETWLRVLP